MKKLSELDISPAPWKHDYEYVSDDMVFDSQGNIVADARSRDDARLCSAAPELYEALLEIYEDFEPVCNCECHGCKHEPGCNKWAAKARAALEKAGGAE